MLEKISLKMKNRSNRDAMLVGNRWRLLNERGRVDNKGIIIIEVVQVIKIEIVVIDHNRLE